jgi:fluoroquinolone transport system permease protein
MRPRTGAPPLPPHAPDPRAAVDPSGPSTRPRGLQARVAAALVRPILRAIPWWPLSAAGAVALGIALVPGLTPAPDVEALALAVRLAAAAGALGAAFLLEDPAERTVATAPSPLLLRRVLRVALILPAGAAWWIAVLALVRTQVGGAAWAGLPVGGLSLEAAGLFAVALALAAAGARGAPAELRGPLAACGLLLLLAVAAQRLPPRVAILVEPGSPWWSTAHHNWLVLLAFALAVFALAGSDPARRLRPRW